MHGCRCGYTRVNKETSQPTKVKYRIYVYIYIYTYSIKKKIKKIMKRRHPDWTAFQLYRQSSTRHAPLSYHCSPFHLRHHYYCTMHHYMYSFICHFLSGKLSHARQLHEAHARMLCVVASNVADFGSLVYTTGLPHTFYIRVLLYIRILDTLILNLFGSLMGAESAAYCMACHIFIRTFVNPDNSL